MEETEYNNEKYAWLILRHQECLKNVWPAFCMFVDLCKKKVGEYGFPLPGKEQGFCFKGLNIKFKEFGPKKYDLWLAIEMVLGPFNFYTQGVYFLMTVNKKSLIMKEDIPIYLMDDVQKAFFYFVEQYFSPKFKTYPGFLKNFSMH